MNLTSTIINSVNDTLLYLNEHHDKLKIIHQGMPPDLFIDEFLTLKLHFPRGCGHSTAAKHLMLQHDAVLITDRGGNREHHIYSIGIPEEKIYYFETLYDNRVHGKFDKLDLVIFDPATIIIDSVKWAKISELKQRMRYTNNVKLFVMLG